MSATRTLPACSRPGSSTWPGLRRKNVTLSRAVTAAPITAPLAPLMPLGRSTATIGAPLAFIASIIARALPVDHAIEPRTEQRIDDDAGAFHGVRRRRLDRSLPELRSLGRIALQRSGVPEQQDPHLIAALGQHPRRHEAVAAIVARPGDDEHARAERMTRDRVGDRAAGLLHQRDARNATRNGEPVALGHFVGCQEFDHRESLNPSRGTLRAPTRRPKIDGKTSITATLSRADCGNNHVAYILDKS